MSSQAVSRRGTEKRIVAAPVEGLGQTIRRLYYAPTNCYEEEPEYYAGFFIDMVTRLQQDFSEGQHFITYVGHSGTLIWGHEKFLTSDDVPNLTNGKKYF